MKKVLILTNSNMGFYKFRRELIKELIKQYQVIIASPLDEYVDRLVEIGCKHIETKINRRGKKLLQDLTLYNLYKRIIKKNQPSVILTYTIKPNIYGGLAARKYNIPYIANVTGLGTALETKGLLQKITVFLYKQAFKKAHTVFFQNQENMDFFEERKIALGKHQLLPGSGVNLEHFKPLPYPTDEVIRFVFISRIMKEKGIEYFLETAIQLKKKYNNLEFHVCGFCEESYEKRLASLHNQRTIIYHGLVSDTRNILQDMHCIIHPTYYPEGMSNVLLESAACGRPIITTNRSGARETIDDNLTGYMIDPKNINQLINSVERFINLTNEEKKQMGTLGRKKMIEQFNRQIVVDYYFKNINKITNNVCKKG